MESELFLSIIYYNYSRIKNYFKVKKFDKKYAHYYQTIVQYWQYFINVTHELV